MRLLSVMLATWLVASTAEASSISRRTCEELSNWKREASAISVVEVTDTEVLPQPEADEVRYTVEVVGVVRERVKGGARPEAPVRLLMGRNRILEALGAASAHIPNQGEFVAIYFYDADDDFVVVPLERFEADMKRCFKPPNPR